MTQFSIIMPSYCGEYKKAAKNRDLKLHRAIKSVQRQICPDWELIVIADGCQRTVEVVNEFKDQRISCYFVEKKPDIISVGSLRNIGIEKAVGEYICYLDSDDMFGENHLTELDCQVNSNYHWHFFNDCLYSAKADSFIERKCSFKAGNCGTSNIVHLRSIPVRWPDYSPYGYDDLNFIRRLQKYRHSVITGAEYFVCHAPGGYDV